MAIQFYKLKVINIIRETADAVSVFFEIPYDLKDTFKYKHGQYLTLRFFFDGLDERRAYSISSSPFVDQDLKVSIKEVDNGKVSSYVNKKLQIGEIVDVMPPLGNFTIELNPNNSKNYFFIAGGSGITPIISIIKSILEVEKSSKCQLIYSNKNEESIIFKNSIEKLSNNLNFRVEYLFSKPNNSENIPSRINESIINRTLKENKNFISPINEYFVCGPQGIMEVATQTFTKLGVSKEQLHKESFTVSLKQEEEVIDLSSNITSLEIDSISVILYGEETTIPIKKDDTILIAGMKARLDPPFSCQIGACSTCRAKLIKGKVKMDDYDALSDSEIAQGFILTCTAHPITNDVIVDYDA